MSQAPSEQYRAYNVWDAPTRWFHWINALAVLGLISVGVMLLNDDALGLSVAKSSSSRSTWRWATSWH